MHFLLYIIIRIPIPFSHADTSDVQMVKVTLIEGANASTIQCEFITGSNATGCMVVLTGIEAYHVNLTRNPSTNLTTSTVTLEHPPSCYTRVEAFDIESDGLVGSLAVPGQLNIVHSQSTCIPPSSGNNTAMIIIIEIAHNFVLMGWGA